jgi:GNAT superfamily N-acetyltransferase
MASLLHSEFDSEALHVNVATLSASDLSEQELENALSLASERQYRVVFWSAPSKDSTVIQQVAKKAGHFCASKVTYRFLINESLLSALDHSTVALDIKEFEDKMPCSELIELSKIAGSHSRFCKDPNLTYTQFESIYSAWMHNSVSGELADVVLTASSESSISGMVTIKVKTPELATIGLLADRVNHRGQDVGVGLIAAALKWVLAKGVTVCEVATQETNTFARALYEKCGGIRASMSTDFHFWVALNPINDPISSIPQNVPYVTGDEATNLQHLFSNQQVATHGKYGTLCQEQLQTELGVLKTLLVTSGTSALELCSLAINTVQGDEFIMPSYTFVSTATAFVNHGGIPVFVDIRRDTQNIDETKIEEAITQKTKAIVVVHYAGVPCEMDTIMSIASRHNLYVIEDNAHGIFSTYKGKPLGSIGHLGAHSFHYTKNLSCGEGGAVFVNSPDLVSPCMISWEKGTNRFDFLSGKVDKYTWVDRGSSFILSEINAAVLAAQVSAPSAQNTFHASVHALKLSKSPKSVYPFISLTRSTFSHS